MPGWMAAILLVAARIAALVVLVPGFQGSWMTWRIRVGTLVLLTMPVLCVMPPYTQVDATVTELIPRLIQEVGIGISLAIVPATLVMGLRFATEAVHGMTGLPSANDTSGEGLGSTTNRFFFVVALTVFFASSGHRHVIQAVLGSFHWLPVGSEIPPMALKELVLDVFSQSFQLGTRAVTPIGLSLAVGFLTLAAVNRVIPQLGYFAIGMSVQTATLLAAIVIFVGGIGLFWEAAFESGILDWKDRWHSLAGSMP